MSVLQTEPVLTDFWRVCWDVSKTMEGRSWIKHATQWEAERERRQFMRECKRMHYIPPWGKVWLQHVVIDEQKFGKAS